MRYSKRSPRISKRSKTRKRGGMLQENESEIINIDISDISKQYELTLEQTDVIDKNMQKLSIKFKKFMDNNKYVTQYFRAPLNKMWRLINQFLHKDDVTSSISEDNIYNLTHDLYDKFFNILMKESPLFNSPKYGTPKSATPRSGTPKSAPPRCESPKSSTPSDNTDNESISQNEVISFIKIQINDIPEGINEVYVLDYKS
jgi:hypothetical protein